MTEASAKTRGDCPLCGGPGGGLAFPYWTEWEGRRFYYRACRQCSTTFIDPLPTEDDFRGMYSRSSYHDVHYSKVDETNHLHGLRLVQPHLNRNSRILDFGCGNGSFIIAAKRLGFACEGVELDEKMRLLASQNAVAEVHALDDLVRSGKRFGTIHLGDVLPHVPDPAATMLTLESLLEPDGVFFAEGVLENNASPVYYSACLFGWVKQRLGRGGGYFTPYRLHRATAASQRAFFERRLGHRLELYHIFETGWPYTSPHSLLRPGSMQNFGRLAIAALARGAARIGNPLGLSLGNRYTAVLKPK
jgi:SAM-dependent methyltransferase